MKLGQMQETLRDLKMVEGLSGQWCNRVSGKVERLAEMRRRGEKREEVEENGGGLKEESRPQS